MLYERHPGDVKINPEAGQAVASSLAGEFGPSNVRHDRYPPKGESPHFPVLMRDGSVFPSTAVSGTLARLPVLSIDYVFIEPGLETRAKEWLKVNKNAIIQPTEETNV
jgi:hypothetical protein